MKTHSELAELAETMTRALVMERPYAIAGFFMGFNADGAGMVIPFTPGSPENLPNFLGAVRSLFLVNGIVQYAFVTQGAVGDNEADEPDTLDALLIATATRGDGAEARIYDLRRDPSARIVGLDRRDDDGVSTVAAFAENGFLTLVADEPDPARIAAAQAYLARMEASGAASFHVGRSRTTPLH